MKKLILAVALSLSLAPRSWANGLTTCEVGVSSPSVVLCGSGAMTLFSVSMDSATTANSWGVVYDSNTVSGYTLGTISDGTAAAPRVAQLNCATAATLNCSEVNVGALTPRNITNGIVVNKKDAGDVIRVLYNKP